MRKLSEAGVCEHGECNEKATEMVYSRDFGKVVFCCERHGDIVIDEGMPEYWDGCANCGCRQGVN